MKLVASFNNEEEFYHAIRIDDLENQDCIKKILELLTELKITDHLENEDGTRTYAYKDWVGFHEFFRNADYTVHLIFSKTNTYILCKTKKKKEFMDAITTRFPF